MNGFTLMAERMEEAWYEPFADECGETGKSRRLF